MPVETHEICEHCGGPMKEGPEFTVCPNCGSVHMTSAERLYGWFYWTCMLVATVVVAVIGGAVGWQWLGSIILGAVAGVALLWAYEARHQRLWRQT
jgi:predicted RNA-binding Zn-ribbon protein involved in translation (DUF1610 family)